MKQISSILAIAIALLTGYGNNGTKNSNTCGINRQTPLIMEWIQSLIDSSQTPVLTAFILGLLTAISPCRWYLQSPLPCRFC